MTDELLIDHTLTVHGDELTTPFLMIKREPRANIDPDGQANARVTDAWFITLPRVNAFDYVNKMYTLEIVGKTTVMLTQPLFSHTHLEGKIVNRRLHVNQFIEIQRNEYNSPQKDNQYKTRIHFPNSNPLWNCWAKIETDAVVPFFPYAVMEQGKIDTEVTTSGRLMRQSQTQVESREVVSSSETHIMWRVGITDTIGYLQRSVATAAEDHVDEISEIFQSMDVIDITKVKRNRRA